MRGKRALAALITALGAALLLAACGGGGGNGSTATTAQGTTPTGTVPGAPQGAQVIPSAIRFDEKALSVTLPLREGRTADGGTTYYVITDSSDRADAAERGVNFAPKLANAPGTRAVQRVSEKDGVVNFEGTVDFSPKGVVKPGPNGFPPDAAEPGAIGDPRYSPLVTTDGETVINASQVANDSGQSDTVVKLDRARMRVTLALLDGFSGGARTPYLHLDASDPVIAALEQSTFADNLDAAPGLASDAKDSARSAIIPIVNGPREKDGADQRQGLESAVLGEGPPLNIQQDLPQSRLYSPVWDIHPAVWSEGAITDGQRHRLVSAEEVAAEVQAGRVTSGGTEPANRSLGGLKAAGFISNCPTIAVLAG